MSIDNVTIHQGYQLPNGTNTLAHDVTRLINALTSVDLDVFLRPLASSSTYVGTTAVALNRTSAAQGLTGITSISSDASTNLSLVSGTTGTLTLDSGTTGPINIGTGANTKTITIGSSTGAVQVPGLLNGITVGSGSGSVANNTAVGTGALATNTTGASNTANGYQSLFANNTGQSNTAVGLQSLYNNVTGTNNTSIGSLALYTNTAGANNTAIGVNALRESIGSGNIGVGGYTSGGAYLPVFTVTTQNDRIVLGSTAVTNAYVQVAWTVVSDARDKTNLSKVPHGLSFVNQLKPTSFQYKLNRENDEPNGPVRYGFLAQDILKLEKDSNVIIDNEDPEKLRYNGESLIPILVNAIQELSAQVKKLQKSKS
jgi:hypothetical protein